MTQILLDLSIFMMCGIFSMMIVGFAVFLAEALYAGKTKHVGLAIMSLSLAMYCIYAALKLLEVL